MSSRDTLKRLERLEDERGTQDEQGLRIRRIIISPGTDGPEQLPVLGWRISDKQHGAIETRLQDGESAEDCWLRHNTAIDEVYGKDAVVMSVQIFE